MKRKIFRAFLTGAIIIGCAYQAYAASGTVFSKPIVVKSATNKTITVSGKWTGDISAGKENKKAVVLVESGFKGKIVLDNVTVKLGKETSDHVCAVKIESGANAEIVLKGKSTIESGAYRAGIEIGDNAKVTFTGSGTLTATGGENAAGIGGGDGMSCGSVIFGEDLTGSIEGKRGDFLRITAAGGSNAAGIGGGSGGAGGKVTIHSGLIEAVGDDKAQDIGFGAGGEPGVVESHGGRLLRYDRIGWDKEDTTRRKQLKLIIPMHYYLHEAKIEAWGYEHSLNFSAVPKPEGGKEEGVLYLYLPEKANRINCDFYAERTTVFRIKSPFGWSETARSVDKHASVFGEERVEITDLTELTVDIPPSVFSNW